MSRWSRRAFRAHDAADPNDSVGDPTAPVDNRKPSSDPFGALSLAITPASFDLTFGAGETSQSQELTINYPQPGNNFIAAVHHVTAIADGLDFREDGQSLYYRNPRSSVETDVTAPYRSEVLEVWRTLWVESDHMNAPGENDGPFDGDPGADDDPRFTPADPTIATLTALLEPAYVRVLPLPAEHDTHNTTTFKHYQNNTNVNPPVKDVDSSRFFWDVHMLGAYEWSMAFDNDPNDQDWYAGYSEMGDDGTNFILEETARDLWAEPELPDMVPYATGLDRVSAHEALHRFFGWHGTDPAADEGIMQGVRSC